MTAPDATAETTSTPPGGMRWGLLLPPLLLLLLAAAWAGFWFYAAHRAGEAIDVWLKREAEHGRVYACGNRQIVGFPFRVELVCDNPTASLPADGGPVTARAPKFLAVAQVYDPNRLIGELTGPVDITTGDGRKASLTFALAQASLNVEGKQFERVSIVFTAPRLTDDSGEIGVAKGAQLHLKRAVDRAPGAYDLAARVDEAVSPAFDAVPVGSGPASFELQAEAHGLDDLRPRPTSERLKAFAEAGGKVHVALARVTRGDVAVEGRGDFALDDSGRLDGRFDIAERGVDAAIKELLSGGGRKGGMSALINIGAQMLGAPSELDGKPATTYRINVEKGKVAIGPIKIYKLPPAF